MELNVEWKDNATKRESRASWKPLTETLERLLMEPKKELVVECPKGVSWEKFRSAVSVISKRVSEGKKKKIVTRTNGKKVECWVREL